PHRSEDRAGHHGERHVIARHQRAVAGREFDPQVANAQQRLRHRSLGLSASRSQSPRRLTASTSPASVTPGKIAIHHSPANRNLLPMLIRVPSEGWVGGSPTPRNDSVASRMMASPRLMVAITRTGPITFGRTWRNRIEV